MKFDRKRGDMVVAVMEPEQQTDGTTRMRLHGPSCPKTRRVDDAFAAAGETRRSGPAQVSTDAYREGWETIFGARQTRGQA